jgi:hypothetical protein
MICPRASWVSSKGLVSKGRILTDIVSPFQIIILFLFLIFLIYSFSIYLDMVYI